MPVSDATGCDRRGPLPREGLSQADRRLAALAGDYFRPDERDLADLILFGQRFARQLKFYDADNTEAGTFAAFFENEVTSALAALAKLPVADFRAVQADLGGWLMADPTRDPVVLTPYAQLWCHLAPGLLAQAAELLYRLPPDHILRRDAPQIMARSLAGPLGQLLSLAKGGLPGEVGLFPADALMPADFNLDGAPGDARFRLGSVAGPVVTQAADLALLGLPAALFGALPEADWAAFYAAQDADQTPYDQVPPGSLHPEFAQVEDLLGYGLLTRAITQIHDGIEALRQRAARDLALALETHAAHAPQMGLWIAFLQLFRHAQADLNGFTDRHLSFYLRDVLRLRPRAASADSAHVVFELAKGRDPALIRAGTALRAGKDGAGMPVHFALVRDLVLYPSKIGELAGLRMTATATGLVPRAAPVLASADGVGEIDLPPDARDFAPFGPAAAPAARIGFAVADRALFLREGQRKIVLRAYLDVAQAETSLPGAFRMRLTGADGWLDVDATARLGVEETTVTPRAPLHETGWTGSKPKPAKTPKTAFAATSAAATAKGTKADMVAPAASRLTLKGRPGWKSDKFAPEKPARTVKRPFLELVAELGPDDPSVVPCDADLHGTEHAPGLPVAEITFDFDAAGPAAFARLRDVTARQVTVQTEAQGLKNLTVLADGATADVAKTFAPFGARPDKGASFHIGSAEIFAKRIAQLSFALTWKTPYGASTSFLDTAPGGYNPTEYVLSRGGWTKAGKADLGLDDAARHPMTSTGAAQIDGLAPMTPDNPPLTADSRTGYLRFDLGADFGHGAYALELTRAMIAIAGGAKYYAGPGVNTRNPEAQSGKFLGVLVLGDGPVDATGKVPRDPFVPELAAITADYVSRAMPVAAFSQLGPFGARAAQADGRLFPETDYDGAILIGLEDFDGPARVSFLCQVLPGSGDPLLVPPALSVDVLDGNRWQRLAAQDVEDGTANLTRSGLLALSLPRGGGGAQTLYPDGLTWIRLSVGQNAAAVNRLLAVHIHAERAEFADRGNDPARLTEPLAAGTIAKLQLPDPAVAKIVQPFPSFGGAPEEAAAPFRTRVSERMRHKNRAITPWDVEALVLEAFPALYRVKCLPITALMRDGSGRVRGDDELRPGAVTVICVPQLGPNAPADPLRPYTDTGTLEAVTRFLRARLSPFVRLEVANPRFEEVAVEFTLRFRPKIGDTEFYKRKVHDALVAHLT
ncbi:MAG: hypothetical protein KDA50_11080, partial [Rhodobacteraceae bacterium]|nr:hypothetical protein [Paracoccaceae bacterium]